MRNPWFHFRQFSLRQDRAAMKITTDACVFGAWTAARIGGAGRILDIGTGTGLLALMAAQQLTGDPASRVEAIEIDQASHDQAAGNFSASPWPEKTLLHYGDAKTFSFPEPFDMVIVNPPFYEGQLVSPHAAVNQARHDSSLLLDGLVAIIARVLQPNGRFSILLPAEREGYFISLARSAGFEPGECLRLRQTPAHAVFRSLLMFERSGLNNTGYENYRLPITELVVRDENGKETPELLGLMAEYYIR